MLRLVLLIAVLALFVDAFFYSGGYTQSVYRQVLIAADHLVALIAGAVDTGPDRDSSTPTMQLQQAVETARTTALF
jgi:hypothetical protein